MEAIPTKQLIRLIPLIQEQSHRLRQSAIQDLTDLAQANEAPTVLALAFALGTILSFVPVPLLDSLLLLFILSHFKQVNRPALLAARVVWNDLVVVPLYVPGYRLGTNVLASLPFGSAADATPLAAFAIGCLALAVAAAVLSAFTMFGVFWTVSQIRRAPAPGCTNASR